MSSEGLTRRTSDGGGSYDNEPPTAKGAKPPRSHSVPVDAASIGSLAIAVAVPLALGIIDGLFNNANQEFYRELKKPSWNPPGWLFGVAWSVLYPAMGVASWLVWRRGGFEKQRKPLGLYLVQLVVNLLWPYLFFGLHNIRLALWDIVALDFLIILCIQAFKPVDPLASTLFKPYLAWVAFATFLNYTLLSLN